MELEKRAELRQNWESRAAACSERWQLSEIKWLPDVSVARVGFCKSPFGTAVLKVNVEPGLVDFESKALAHFGPELCPRVYGTAVDLDALLIQHIDAVQHLSDWYPDPKREIDAWLPFLHAVKSRSVVPPGFPTIVTFAEIFDRMLKRKLTPEMRQVMENGRDRQHILMGSPSENRLLHGDLHHFNLLLDRNDRWWMIDPSGVIGHPHYEMGAFLRNPWGACYTEPGVLDRLKDRVCLLAERLALPPTRVAEYGFYGAAFSVAWSLEEEGDDFEGMMIMAETCLKLV